MTLSFLKVLVARPAGCKCGVLRKKLLGFQGPGFCRHQTDPWQKDKADGNCSLLKALSAKLRERDGKKRPPNLSPANKIAAGKIVPLCTMYLVSRQLIYYEVFGFLYFTGADPLLVLRDSWDGLAIQFNSRIYEVKTDCAVVFLWLTW